MPSAPAISFEWKPSRAWRAVRWGLLVVGGACLAWSGLELLAKGALAVAAGLLEWRNLGFERKWDGSSWQFDGEGRWGWKRAEGESGSATLMQATLLGPLIVLNLRDASGRIDLPIWPDQLDVDARRRLRVRLSLSNPAPVDSARP